MDTQEQILEDLQTITERTEDVMVQNEMLIEENDRFAGQIAYLEDKVDELTADIQRITNGHKQETEVQDNYIAELEDDLKKIEDKLKQIEENPESVAIHENVVLQGVNDRLESDNITKQKKIDELLAKQTSMENIDTDAMDNRLIELAAEVEGLKTDRYNLSQKNEGLNQEIGILKATINELTTKSGLIDHTECQNRELSTRNRVIEITEKLSALYKEIYDHMLYNQKLNHEIEGLNATISALTHENNELKNNIKPEHMKLFTIFAVTILSMVFVLLTRY